VKKLLSHLSSLLSKMIENRAKKYSKICTKWTEDEKKRRVIKRGREEKKKVVVVERESRSHL
jgi:hypothetical protein